VDKIGSSYIAKPDLIIFGGAIVLYYFMRTLPPNSRSARVVALICGLAIASIVVVIPVAITLTESGRHWLFWIGFMLAMGLWDWNKARMKSKLNAASPPQCQSTGT
jgi:chromate transport protein ChrA